ncbi:MAG TPA: glycosyltransferase family 39 protein [Solirubrobacteraceae bacterium]|jgi:mannosyltransferase|nr:glycosyltransferase family 39 protein [Solirubrobacteraceae bacterium]
MVVDTLRPDTPPPRDAPASARRRWQHRLIERGRGVPVNRWTLAALVLVLMLASAALRVGQLRFHYWIDEAISVGIASHRLGALHALLRQDGSPPLYYLLLHGWIGLWGRGEVATHLLSLVFAVVAVPVAYGGAAGLFGRRVGVYAAVLAAGLPFLTAYAQETRMYSLMALLSLLVAVGFVQGFVQRRQRYLALLALSLAAALYTHNWALFLGVATFVAFIVVLWLAPVASRPALGRDGGLVFGAVALMYLPWVPTLLYQAGHTGAPWALSPVVWSLSEGLYFLVGGRGAAVAILFGAGIGLIGLRGEGRSPRPTAVAAIALGVLGVGTLLIAWVYAKTTPAWSGRYLAVIVGPLLLLAALGLARARGEGVIALILVCCFWVLDPRPSSLDTKSNVAAVAAVMRPHLGRDTLVLSTQPEQVPTIAYYLPRLTRFATPLGAVSDPGVMDWRNALARFERSSVTTALAPVLHTLPGGRRVLLVVPASFQKTPRWMALIHRSSRRWLSYLRQDPRLRLIKVSALKAHASDLPVRGWLFTVR